jgi:hypothetical protein
MRSPHSPTPRPAPRPGAAILTLISLAALLIAGCGVSSSARASSPATSATTPVPTATNAPTPVPTADLSTLSGPCAPASGSQAATVPHYQIGDLIITEARLSLDYPAQQLPDGTPLQPVRLPSQSLSAEFPDSPPVNPHLKENPAGYQFLVCNNAPTQAHVIQSVSVRIASFTPYSGQLSAWQFCDGTFVRPQGANAGGCGGYAMFEEYLHATFPANAGADAAVTAAQISAGGLGPPGATQVTPLPDTLVPGKSLSFDIGLTPPTVPGLYAFAFGLAIDGQPPAFFSTAQPVLLAPVVHKWTGKACEAPAMQAQIPQTVTNPPTLYICPES